MRVKTMHKTLGVTRSEVVVMEIPPQVVGRSFTEDDRRRVTSRSQYRGPLRCRLQTLMCPVLLGFTSICHYRLVEYLYIFILYCVRNIGLFSQGRTRVGNFKNNRPRRDTSERSLALLSTIVLKKHVFNPSSTPNQSWDAPQICRRRIRYDRRFQTVCALSHSFTIIQLLL